MQIKALRSMVGTYGRLRRNEVRDIPTRIAEQLIQRGKALPVGGTEGAAARGAGADPTKSRRSGGQPGKGKRSSSSPRGRARANKTSSGSGEKPAS